MRFLGRSLTALFLTALTVGLLAWAVQITFAALEDRRARDGGGPPARERVLSVNVVAAEPETVAPVLTAFGEVRARRVLELRAPVAGRIVELAEEFEEGGRIEGGQLLMVVDPAGAEAALAMGQADLAGAEAELRDAERGLELARAERLGAEAQRDLQAQALQRQLDLSDRGVGSAAAVETAELALAAAEQTVLTRRGAIAQAETRIEAARVAVDRSRIEAAEAERDLAERRLTASFGGRLAEVSAILGGLVSANEQVATLVDPDALEVSFRLSAAQHSRLLDTDGSVRGAPIRATLEVQGLALMTVGRITREAPEVGEGQTGRLVFATLQDARGFRPGDFLRVEVEEPEIEDAIRLPATALSAQNRILVLDAENRLTEVEVALLRRQGDDILVKGEIAGRQVVAERTAALGAGIRVEPLGAPGAEPREAALVTLDAARRARIVAYVQGNSRIPSDVKTRMLTQLEAQQVPAAMIERLESRMGG